MTSGRPLRVSAAAIACVVAMGSAAAAGSPVEPVRELRISASIRQWFGVLAAQPAEGGWPESRMSEAPLVFRLTEGGSPGSNDLAAWLVALRSPHPRVEYRIGELHLESVGEDLVRVRFEFDRHSTDEQGLPHLVRREQTWLIRDPADEVPVVLRIDERRLLAFPGTGPQIVCY